MSNLGRGGECENLILLFGRGGPERRVVARCRKELRYNSLAYDRADDCQFKDMSGSVKARWS
jgi:hypothetical protein